MRALRKQGQTGEWTDPRWSSPEEHLVDTLEQALDCTPKEETRKKIKRWLLEIKNNAVVSQDLIQFLRGQMIYCDGDKPYVSYLKNLLKEDELFRS
jgi:hypothetical protein